MDYTDQPKNIRKGEEIDSTRLEEFLGDNIPGLQGEIVVQQFPGGRSNLTYMVSFGDRELVLRRPPFGIKAKTAHDMGREFRVLNALNETYPYAPSPLAYTDDISIIGCPFYVMERISGIIVRREFPSFFERSSEKVRKLCRKLLEVHYELHAIDYRTVGLENFGKPAGYVERQVTGWSDRYRNARTPDAPDCENIMVWLQDKMPVDSENPAIIHNDFKLDNVVLNKNDPKEIIGVLDWEMATIGDPLMDLGGSLAYWVQKNDPSELQAIRLMPTDADGALTREELVGYYAELSGRDIDSFDFYYCFGLFRLAVIGQQIYNRFYHGQTKDDRFKDFFLGVHALEKTLMSRIKRSSL
jgi:aminoglycoside phosphotransferase (APT) family kinase protein